MGKGGKELDKEKEGLEERKQERTTTRGGTERERGGVL